MIYRYLADFVVVIHGAFIVFSILGALLALRWFNVVWVHIPCATWGVLVQVAVGGTCPLTPLENYFRNEHVEYLHAQGYSTEERENFESFIDYYITDLIYLEDPPDWLHPVLGIGVLTINTTVYSILIARARRGARRRRAEAAEAAEAADAKAAGASDGDAPTAGTRSYRRLAPGGSLALAGLAVVAAVAFPLAVWGLCLSLAAYVMSIIALKLSRGDRFARQAAAACGIFLGLCAMEFYTWSITESVWMD